MIKIMCMADLHWDILTSSETFKLSNNAFLNVQRECPDILLIAGDVISSDTGIRSPYKLLYSVFGNEIPIICVLGNHEFFNHKIDDVLKKYQEMYKPDKYNVHYLDIIGHYDFRGIRFFGNTLWYDGSMKQIPNQKVEDWAGRKWNDKLIKDFDPMKENKRCLLQLKENYDRNRFSILLTHHIPHGDLDGHLSYVGSEFDIFSGMKNLFSETGIKPNYSVCGHTHKRICKEIEGVKAVNVGNDYHQALYEIIEIDEDTVV